MVLADVKQSAIGIIKLAAAFNINSFPKLNVNALNVVLAQGTTHKVVGKAEGQNILDGFLSQVVVNAVDLIFFKELIKQLINLHGVLQVAAEGFFNY